MKIYGLIGFPLTHSFSKRFFTEKFEQTGIPDCRYALFPIEDVGLLSSLIAENPEVYGLNVTIPHKVSVLPFLNGMDAAAQEIGAVNCIAIRYEGGSSPVLKGYNTDAIGFENSLKPLLKPWHRQALIFGDGGAAQAVKYVLKKLDIAFTVVSRAARNFPYEKLDAAIMQQHTLLINTTPVGMEPDTAAFPDIPYAHITPAHLGYDLIYNPNETRFLQMIRERGGQTKNGLEMLYLQAEASWDIWNQQ